MDKYSEELSDTPDYDFQSESVYNSDVEPLLNILDKINDSNWMNLNHQKHKNLR